MTDEEKLKAQQLEFIKKLQAIGSDLWGGAAGASSGTEAEGGAEQASHPDQPSENGKQSLPKKNKVQTRPEIGIENLWMTADETIDWTDALAYERPNDGLTAPGLWQYYHRMAEKVLSGDIQAYAEVLRKMNPLGDLTGYADGLTMRAPDAERLEGQFTCRADYLEKNGTEYLAHPTENLGNERYFYSKLCNLYFTYELDRKLKEKNSNISCNAFNPGFMPDTNLNSMPQSVIDEVKTKMPERLGSLSVSSKAVAKLLTEKEFSHVSGKYFSMSTTPVKSSELSYNLENARELWKISSKFSGLN